jgi:CRP-like cAMP-binding protein
MVEVLLRKLGHGARLSSAEATAVRAAVTDIRHVPAHEVLIHEGDAPEFVHVVLSGYVCRYKMLPDGGRQIMAWLVPGDFCDLHVSLLGQMDHSIATLSAARVARIPRKEANSLALGASALTRAFWWATLVDEGVLREWLVNMGRRPASPRIAHLFCELHSRLSAVGLVHEGALEFPLTQADLADTVGLTTVHVNRVIRWLREAGLLAWKGHVVTIEDVPRLRAFADFDPNYLHLAQLQPRAAA